MPYKITFKNQAAFGEQGTASAKTLTSAIQKAVRLSSQAPGVRHEVYFRDEKTEEWQLMMVVKDGINIESKG